MDSYWTDVIKEKLVNKTQELRINLAELKRYNRFSGAVGSLEAAISNLEAAAAEIDRINKRRVSL